MQGQLPLEGIRVVDLTIWVQGPLVGGILADLGAEVIKIEKPGTGDFSRGARGMHNQNLLLPDGRSLMWELPNRNKKAIAVNLYRPEGQEVLYRLIRRSQVMVTNLEPAALRQMGADREAVLAQNAELIYAQSTGFGPRGPYAEDPCLDTVGMARSGFMFLNATPEGEPVYPYGALSDVMSGTTLALGVLSALLARERLGKTPAVYTSQLSSMMWLALFPVAVYANLGDEYPSFDRTNVSNPMQNIYRCADGQWFALGLFVTERFWHDFCDEMGLAHLEHDPRFATDEQRAANRKELIAILDALFATQPRAEWERRFRARRFWCSVVNRYSDLPGDAQVQANEYLVTLDNGLAAVPLPFELSGMKPPRRAAPAYSEHTDEVLTEVCGYSWDELVELKAGEIVW